jgi:hypothetical protein
MKSNNGLFAFCVFGMFCALGMSGCATPVASIDYYDVDTATLERIKSMTVIDDATLASGDYKDLGKVTGMHCRRTPPAGGGYRGQIKGPKRTAIDQLKLRAAKKGASHITEPQCDINESMDLSNNCWSSIKCSSKAMSR